jgi:hypothetical protein
MPALSLPAPIMAELRAANAKRLSEWDGPDGRRYQLWTKSNGAMVLAALYPNGSAFLWRPLQHINAQAATVDVLRAYLANPLDPYIVSRGGK